MGTFFSLDGPFYRFGTVVGDIMIISLLWIVCSLPVVTIGASTTAAFYVMTRRISKSDGYVFRDFWNSFKREFVRSTAVFMTIAVLMVLLLIGMMVVRDNGPIGFIRVFQFIFMFELIVIAAYIFPLLARFDMNYAALFRTSFYMANRHILTTVMIALIIGGIYILIGYSGILILVSPGLYCFLTSYFFIRIFKKYRPDIDVKQAIELAPLNLGENAAEEIN